MIRLLLALTLVFGTFPVQTAEQAPDPEALQDQLQALEEEIEKFRSLLQSTEGEKSELETSLEDNEKSINNILRRIRALEGNLSDGEAEVSRLRGQESELIIARDHQQDLIGQQVAAAYKLGNQEHLKVLLNQEDPNEVSRMLTWYNYFNEARNREVEAYEQTITELEAIRQQISDENVKMAASRDALKSEREDLLQVQREKQVTLVALNREIEVTGGRIERLTQDREQLETLLRQLERRLARLPSPTEVIPFGQLKGKMSLPVAGRIAQQFGSQRVAGRLRWNGMLIEADAGEPVQAIHYGHVVFADWLRGFGLMIIINHGDGYMSLYGHNQVLYRETGDWVTAGETIATVGDSGGQIEPGLYFEIRVSGKPENPQLWCKAQPDSGAV